MKRFSAFFAAIVMLVSIVCGVACTPSEPKETYTLVLDYNGAEVSGERQYTVAYGESLPALPLALKKEHYDFRGWYTAQERGGVKVCDEYGLVPVKSIVNEDNFDLSKQYIYLYAGFELDKISVTFRYGQRAEDETMQIPYGTPISSVISKTRVDGKAVLSWSLSEGDNLVFHGAITSPITLYALEYAPVIELNANGGTEVLPVVARAGETVSLPVPTRENYRFVHWADEGGNAADISVMPAASVALKAVWKAKISFDANGGTEAEDICVDAGAEIKLPTTEKAGFAFAGWYTENREPYEATVMPSAGIRLKAGWYEIKNERYVVVDGSNRLGEYDNSTRQMKSELCLDFSAFLPADYEGTVSVEGHLKIGGDMWSWIKKLSVSLSFYSENTVSEYSYLYGVTFSHPKSDYYEKYQYSFTANLKGNKIYGALTADSNGYVSFKDYYVLVSFADKTKLYL